LLNITYAVKQNRYINTPVIQLERERGLMIVWHITAAVICQTIICWRQTNEVHRDESDPAAV